MSFRKLSGTEKIRTVCAGPDPLSPIKTRFFAEGCKNTEICKNKFSRIAADHDRRSPRHRGGVPDAPARPIAQNTPFPHRREAQPPITRTRAHLAPTKPGASPHRIFCVYPIATPEFAAPPFISGILSRTASHRTRRKPIIPAKIRKTHEILRAAGILAFPARIPLLKQRNSKSACPKYPLCPADYTRRARRNATYLGQRTPRHRTCRTAQIGRRTPRPRGSERLTAPDRRTPLCTFLSRVCHCSPRIIPKQKRKESPRLSFLFRSPLRAAHAPPILTFSHPYRVPVTVRRVTPGVTVHAPVAVSRTNVAAGTVITPGTVTKVPVA